MYHRLRAAPYDQNFGRVPQCVNPAKADRVERFFLSGGMGIPRQINGAIWRRFSDVPPGIQVRLTLSEVSLHPPLKYPRNRL